jgi:hypothetical protein
LADWQARPNQVTFSVEIPEAADLTRCRVCVERVGPGWRLSFSHTGWCRLGLPGRRARLLRRRFTMAWVAALEHARDLARSG